MSYRGLGQAVSTTDTTTPATSNAALIAGTNANKLQTLNTSSTLYVATGIGVLAVGGLVVFAVSRHPRRRRRR